MGPILVRHASFPGSPFFYFGPCFGSGRGHRRGHSSCHEIEGSGAFHREDRLVGGIVVDSCMIGGIVVGSHRPVV